MAKKDEKTQAKDQQDNKEPKESKESKAAQKADDKSSGFNVNTFIQGTKEELDKVVWPSRQQLISESIAVILMVTLSATSIYLIDNLFRWVSQKVF